LLVEVAQPAADPASRANKMLMAISSIEAD
jgi:hypothetical protein